VRIDVAGGFETCCLLAVMRNVLLPHRSGRLLMCGLGLLSCVVHRRKEGAVQCELPRQVSGGHPREDLGLPPTSIFTWRPPSATFVPGRSTRSWPRSKTTLRVDTPQRGCRPSEGAEDQALRSPSQLLAYFPLLRHQWPLVETFKQQVQLVPGQQFLARHQRIAGRDAVALREAGCWPSLSSIHAVP